MLPAAASDVNVRIPFCMQLYMLTSQNLHATMHANPNKTTDQKGHAMSQFKYIEYKKRKDKIAELILNRPDKLNAIHDEMRYEMLAALEDAEKDDDINCLILKGNGDSFSAGHDLTRVGTYYGFENRSEGVTKEDKRRPNQRVRLRRDRDSIARIYQERFMFSWIPIIAQIHGHCIGGAMILTLACDITIAAEDSKIGYTEQRLGFAGNIMDLGMLTTTVGTKKAQQLILTGKLVSGTEASAMGLVSEAVPRDKLEETVEATAAQIARMPRDGLVIGRASKEMTYNSLGIASDKAHGVVMHTMMTNLRWESDEYNFFKARNASGTHHAIHERNAFFESAGKKED